MPAPLSSLKNLCSALFVGASAALAAWPGDVLSAITGPRLAPGYQHTLALKTDGSLWTWGYNFWGQLGDGTTTLSRVPKQVGTGYAGVAAGYYHSFALRSDGSLWAWGSNENGELGDGTTADSSVPKQIGNNYVAISATSCETIGLKDDGSLWVWGCNPGLLFTNRDLPLPQPLATGAFTAIASGVDHHLALQSDGSLWAWGSNSKGQLGDGTTTYAVRPKQIGTGYAAIAAGTAQFSLALKPDGTLWTWGYNLRGQLGDGTTTDSRVPKQIGSGFTAIAAGMEHAVALKSGGTLWTWGYNYSGQLGDGTTTNSLVPKQIGTGYAAIAAGHSNRTVATKSDGSLWAWGSNFSGELGDGTSAESHVPKQIGAGFAAPASVPALVPQCTLTATPSSISPGQSATLTASCSPTATSYVWTNAPFSSSASSGSVSPAATTTYSVAGRNVNGTGGTASATVTVTASPPATSATLTVVKQGTGQGFVGSSPSGIDCGSTCSATFPPNTAVTLSALVARTHRFAGWSGDCSGTALTVTVTMSGAKRCVATFQLPSLQLLSDGGFEGNSGAWLQSAPSGQRVFPSGPFPHSGQNHAQFGPRSGTWNVYTTVQIPAGTTARLQFWYSILDGIGAPGAPPAVDNMNVTVWTPVTGSLLATLAGFSSDAPTPSWVQSTAYDLSAFAGQTVRLMFGANISENGAGRTNSSFRLDDVSLLIDESGGAATHTGLWWNSSEPGWGINFSHQGNILFGTLFTYDAAGKPLWLVMSNGAKQGATETYSGDLYRTRGPVFDAATFAPLAAANVTRIGSMTVTLSGNGGTLRYSVNGINVTKSIEKQVFGHRAAACLSSASGGPSNYQDLWWNPAEAGWGLNVTHQGDTIFATLFTYGDDNEAAWYVMSEGVRQRTDMSWKGDLYQTTGPAFNAQPFTSATARRVGTMEFIGMDESNATLVYSVNGRQVRKLITRQPFSSPATRCGS